MKPQSEAELAELISTASTPFAIRGGGTRPIGHDVSGDLLVTEGLSGITLYEPGALTVVVKTGTPLSELEAVLDAEAQRLPFEPMDHRGLLGTQGTPTVGGMVAANVSGPRRIQAGACRDYMLGVRYVDGLGNIVKNGGRVMKNVTGYDLVKLMGGSWGTLGVMTEVSLKVLPRPDAAACIMVDGLTDAKAIDAMSAAFGSPFDVTGAAHVPVGLDGDPVTMIRVEGFEKSVEYRAQQLTELLGKFGPIRVEADPAKVAQGWAWVRDAVPMQKAVGDIWRISVKPSDAAATAAAVQANCVLYDWGGGLIWAAVSAGTDLRKKMSHIPGHATLVRASAETRAHLPVFQPESAPVTAISQGLKSRFDPKNLLNPGRMVL